MNSVNDTFNLTSAVRDPLWHHIYLTPDLMEASTAPEFTRLFRIKQLGPTELVYSGATHTRASHSYGVYAVSLRLLDVLLKKGADAWVTKKGAASFLAAALFHDAGHFPYTHSLKELPLASHEELTARIVTSKTVAPLLEKTGADSLQVAAIVSNAIPTKDTETLFFRKLLSGVLDPDKLDYLNRDALFCGVPYGIQDTDFILSNLIPDKTHGIVLEKSGILSVEHVLFSKYLMYRAVYWHKTVRIATAMMKKTLFAALKKGVISAEALYSLDDISVFDIIKKRDFAEKSIAEFLQNRKPYRIVFEIPFDDANAHHTKLENLSSRTDFECRLSEKAQLHETDILIDIPERISFETDLRLKGGKGFADSETVFEPHTIASFTENLRKIRVALNPEKNENHAKKLCRAAEELFS